MQAHLCAHISHGQVSNQAANLLLDWVAGPQNLMLLESRGHTVIKCKRSGYHLA